MKNHLIKHVLCVSNNMTQNSLTLTLEKKLREMHASLFSHIYHGYMRRSETHFKVQYYNCNRHPQIFWDAVIFLIQNIQIQPSFMQ